MPREERVTTAPDIVEQSISHVSIWRILHSASATCAWLRVSDNSDIEEAAVTTIVSTSSGAALAGVGSAEIHRLTLASDREVYPSGGAVRFLPENFRSITRAPLTMKRELRKFYSQTVICTDTLFSKKFVFYHIQCSQD
eukprot:jgi/Ulvmu1/7297/UM035_0086.1